MSVKTQGTELNRTVTNFFANADFGSFGAANQGIVLKSDAARKLFITGFAFTWRVGVAADINANSFCEVMLAENFQVDTDSNTPIFPGINSSLRFYYANNSPQFQNILEIQFQSPFKLIEGVLYSMIASITQGAAFAGTVTSRFTVFGFEQHEGETARTFYSQPR